MRDKHSARQAGQALVFVALGLVVVLAFLGFGIDFGYYRFMQRQLQSAADAGAVAGALEVPACGVSPGCATMQNAVTTALSENGFSGATVNTGACPAAPITSLQVYVNNPPKNCMGALAPSGTQNPNEYVEVVVAQQEPLFFANVIPGVAKPVITTRSEALTGNGPNCMYSLDPSNSGAISLVAPLQSACGIIDESSSSSALDCGSLTAPYVGVNGNVTGTCSPTTPTTGIPDPTPSDPLQYLQASLKSGAPATGSCGSAPSGNLRSGTYIGSKGAITITGTVILNPGTYCGGITVGSGANVTFNSGIYTLNSTPTGSRGGLTINAGTTVSGSGVGFYNAGPGGGINFICSSCTAGSVVLTAPNASNCGTCSAAWQGILFYQDPTNTTASVVVGSSTSNTKPTGTSYFPDASVTYAFDASVTYNILVAKDITIGLTWNGTNINTNTYNNYSELADGSPIKSGAVLVQ